MSCVSPGGLCNCWGRIPKPSKAKVVSAAKSAIAVFTDLSAVGSRLTNGARQIATTTSTNPTTMTLDIFDKKPSLTNAQHLPNLLLLKISEHPLLSVVDTQRAFLRRNVAKIERQLMRCIWQLSHLRV